MTAEVRQLLAPTSMPPELVDQLLGQASATWLIGQSSELVAGELILCHPPLAPAEIRAVAKPTANPRLWRLTVAAQDRPGLLADMAAVLADQRLSITNAAATVLPGAGVALQRVSVGHGDGHDMTEEAWSTIGRRLQAVLGRREPAPRPDFSPAPPVTVVAQPQELGRALVTVEAPDGIGLLWAVSSWLSDHGCNVEAYQATSESGTARDTFLVAGDVNCTDLARAVSGTEVANPRLPGPLRAGIQAGVVVLAVAAAALVRASRALRRP